MNSSFFEGGPKTLFYSGLFLGVAATLVLVVGLMLTTGLNFNGQPTKTADAAGTTPPPTATDPQPTDPVAGPVAPATDKDHWTGAKDAKVTLIEYSDFECPFCERHAPTLQQLLDKYPNDVKLVYRHFPLTALHPNAQKAAEASECATKLGGEDAFWDFHDRVFAAQANGLSVAVFKKIAGDMGLDQKSFDSCLDSGEMTAVVNADAASGNDAGVQGTPATFVNGQLVSGAVPFSTLDAIVQSDL